MSDFAGRPLFGSMFNGDEDHRAMFVDQMRDFADTLDGTTNGNANGDMILFMLTPYLSMFGASSLVHRLNGEVLLTILNEAADTAEADSECNGVIFGYHTDNKLQLVTFDFAEGGVGQKTIELSPPGSTVGEEIFFGLSIKQHIDDAIDELGVIPLWNTTSLLCGVSVGV